MTTLLEHALKSDNTHVMLYLQDDKASFGIAVQVLTGVLLRYKSISIQVANDILKTYVRGDMNVFLYTVTCTEMDSKDKIIFYLYDNACIRLAKFLYELTEIGESRMKFQINGSIVKLVDVVNFTDYVQRVLTTDKNRLFQIHLEVFINEYLSTLDDFLNRVQRIDNKCRYSIHFEIPNENTYKSLQAKKAFKICKDKVKTMNYNYITDEKVESIVERVKKTYVYFLPNHKHISFKIKGSIDKLEFLYSFISQLGIQKMRSLYRIEFDIVFVLILNDDEDGLDYYDRLLKNWENFVAHHNDCRNISIELMFDRYTLKRLGDKAGFKNLIAEFNRLRQVSNLYPYIQVERLDKN